MERFANRREAGEHLAAAVAEVVHGEAVVGGIPRGGIVVAAPAAARLGSPLVPVYARKLPVPVYPELAFGAVDDDGEVVLDPWIVKRARLEEGEIARVRSRVCEEIDRRRKLYGGASLESWLPGRTVVLVDDGLATGLTMRAAVAHARRHGASEVVVATPCASEDAAARFRAEADRFVSLVVDPLFTAVGAYYVDFAAVEDREVLVILTGARHTGAGAASGAPRD